PPRPRARLPRRVLAGRRPPRRSRLWDVREGRRPREQRRHVTALRSRGERHRGALRQGPRRQPEGPVPADRARRYAHGGGRRRFASRSAGRASPPRSSARRFTSRATRRAIPRDRSSRWTAACPEAALRSSATALGKDSMNGGDMKKAKTRSQREPSAASPREIPEVDFSKSRIRRNPYAARVAREGLVVQIGRARPRDALEAARPG